MIAGPDTSIPPIGLEPLTVIRTGFALGRVPCSQTSRGGNVAVLIVVLVIASGCIAWGIIIASDQPVSHKAAVTQKVLPLKVGRGAPID